jgi:nucleoside-diphosphate-sugar epimerase
MNILITGINGFVGTNFTKSWGIQHVIYGLDIHQSEIAGVVQTYGWQDLKEIPQVDVIIHLAGIAQDVDNNISAKTFFAVNTELTEKIFEFFLKSNASKFIFFSSVKAVTDSVKGYPLTEMIKPRPKTLYGLSKLRAEEYVFNRYLTTRSLYKNKSVYILRPCMIYGPGNKGNLNLLYQVVSKGIPWPLGAFDNRRSFCSIDNIAFVVEQLIVRDDIPSGIYQVCDDEALSTNELIGLINESLGKKTLIWKLPKAFMTAVAGVCGTLHLPLDKERLRKLTENYVVSNRKIKSALGIEKMPVSAREGIRKTLESFKNC